MFTANAAKWAMASALTCGLTSAAFAQQADNPLKSVMKILGFATDAPQAQDFVVKSRPEKEPGYIPVFQAPPEPAEKALDSRESGQPQGRPRFGREARRRVAGVLPARRQGGRRGEGPGGVEGEKHACGRQSIARGLRRRPARCYRTVTASRANSTDIHPKDCLFR